MGKSLRVYRASAGSGKTFTLATEYIKLLILNPQSYKHILAVTFTNKATREMKMRILSQLYGLSHRLPSSSAYMNVVCRDLCLDEQAVARQAASALHDILHNYQHFRIETIDKFFQRVLRQLSRELDLPATLQVSLDDELVGALAVDTVVGEIEAGSRSWRDLMGLIGYSMDEGNGWNVLNGLKEFSNQIFKDFYRSHGRELEALMSDDELFERYKSGLRAIVDDTRSRLREGAREFRRRLAEAGLSPNDLSHKSKGIASFFNRLERGQLDQKLYTSTVAAHREGEEAWVAKKAVGRDAIIAKLIEYSFVELLEDCCRIWDGEGMKRYISAQLILEHLDKLRLMAAVERQLRQMNEETGTFMLSDTAHLLSELIEGDDAPFVFEKIGSEVDYIMIDEFQDTSVAQWNNFRVLLGDVMSRSEHGGSLIVGDVKQSIYRWRGSDWRLLNSVDEQLGNAAAGVEYCTLRTNYRSARRVVEFNNCFFATARDYLVAQAKADGDAGAAEQIERAYRDVEQDVPGERGDEGYVRVVLLDKEDYKQQTFRTVEEHILNLLEAGVAPRDIAILARQKSSIEQLAAYFEAACPAIRIRSDEAFLLSSSSVVVALVKAMELVLHPEDELLKAEVDALCHSLGAAPQPIKIEELRIKNSEGEIQSPIQNSELRIKTVGGLRGASLIDLAMNLYKQLGLADCQWDESAYVSAFFDRLSDFVANSGGSLGEFIELWNKKLCQESIPVAEADGIRAITIHKSKGLEFGHVIVPFCDWQMQKANIIWCRPEGEPFDSLPVVPITDTGSRPGDSIFAREHKEEEAQLGVDNLNLLYVAFTRACKGLLVIGQRDGAKGTRSPLIEETIGRMAEKAPPVPPCRGEKANEFFFGSQTIKNSELRIQDKGQTSGENVFLLPSEPVCVKVEAYNEAAQFRQSNKSREFTAGEEADEQRQSYIRMGNVLHSVFARLHTLDDIPKVALELSEELGVGSEELEVRIKRALASGQARSWFSPRWTLLNECSIVYRDKDGQIQTRRPDRVMTADGETVVVDFKFGRRRLEEHRVQVSGYMELLKQMGYEGVRGYLWYVGLEVIEEV